MAAAVTSRRRAQRERWLKPVLRVSILVAFLAGWQLIGNDRIRLAMPSFTRTLSALGDVIADGSLVQGMLITNQALVGGYLLALLVSLPLGIMMGSSRFISNLSMPYLTILLATPMIALVPIVQLIFGFTLTARIVVVFLFAFIYIAFNTMVGVRTVDPSLREMARSYGASRAQMLRLITLPAAVPSIMAGIRLGLGRAIIGMVIAELSLIGAGIGSLILEYQVRFQPAYVFAIVMVAVLEGVVLMEIARRIEARLVTRRGGSSVV